MVLRRIERVSAFGLTSSYKKRRNPRQRWGVEVFKDAAYITPDMFKALVKLNKAVKSNGGELYITGLFRSWRVQAIARKRFKTGEKKDFVAKPGGSFHNAGRAVDISVKELNFEGVNKKDWLQTLWDLAKPLGFEPIIRIPEINASEAWHFDFPGKDWLCAYEELPYARVAKCAILDIGCWNKSTRKTKLMKMFVQAQLIRVGYFDIGEVDGIFGPKTNRALKIEGYDNMDVEKICRLRGWWQ